MNEQNKEYAIGQEVDGCVVTEQDSCIGCKYENFDIECIQSRCDTVERTDGKTVIFRPLITLLLILLTLTSSAQINWRTVAIRSSLLFTSGFCDGTSEVLKVKYESFERVFPGANDQFWDYRISWTNKYSHYPTPKFPLSTTAFVGTTDGYHMMRTFRNATMVTAIVIPLHGKKNWKQYVVEGLIYYCSYTAGFNMSYDVVFGKEGKK